MRRIIVILACLMVWPLAGLANSYIYTNVVTAISPSAHPLTFEQRYLGTYRLILRTASGNPYNLSGFTAAWEVEDVRNGVERINVPATILSTNGLLEASAAFSSLQPGSHYRGRVRLYLSGTTNAAGVVADDWITVTETCTDCATSGGGSGGDMSITITTGVESVTSGSGNVVTGVVGNGSSIIEVQYGSVAGGGGGTANITGTYPIVVTTIGTTQWISYAGGGTVMTPPSYTNTQIITYSSPTSSTFTVPAGTSNIYCYLWGAGGGAGRATTDPGGAGGYIAGIIPVAEFESLTLTIGQGGQTAYYTGGATNVAGGYPNGGKGWVSTTGSNRSGGGGGSTDIRRGTNILLLAAGGGGAGDEGWGGAGGGLTGSDCPFGYESNPGLGGTQTAGGLTNGTWYSGGDYLTSVTESVGGGGGGWFGGGAGYGINAGGGGGSSYGHPYDVTFFVTVNGVDGTPPQTDHPYYVSGVGVGGTVSPYTGGDGLMVIQWE